MVPAENQGIAFEPNSGNQQREPSSSTGTSSKLKYIEMFSLVHLTQTLLHVLQYTISLILMLGFMTFNVWICLAILFGSAIGFWCFGWIKYDPRAQDEDCDSYCH